jgi:hypothetical protein
MHQELMRLADFASQIFQVASKNRNKLFSVPSSLELYICMYWRCRIRDGLAEIV